MSVLSALQAAGVGRVEHAQRVHDRQVDTILDLTLGKVRARFAVEEKRRAPYPKELAKLQPIQKLLAVVGIPRLVVPFVSEWTAVVHSIGARLMLLKNSNIERRRSSLRPWTTNTERPLPGISPAEGSSRLSG